MTKRKSPKFPKSIPKDLRIYANALKRAQWIMSFKDLPDEYPYDRHAVFSNMMADELQHYKEIDRKQFLLCCNCIYDSSDNTVHDSSSNNWQEVMI